MTKIYAVSCGCYSDYKVVALFSTERDAELFIERHPGRWSDWNDVEEYELDSGVEKLREGWSFFHVHMHKDGNSEVEIEATFIDSVSDRKFEPHNYVRENPWFNWYGWARDAEHAVKIANEHRLMLIAQEGAKCARRR